MALTREDLQAIRELMQEETAPIKADLQGVKADVQGLKTNMHEVIQRFDPIEVDLHGLKTNMHEVIQRFDPIEVDLQGLKTDMQEVKQRVVKIEVTQENVVVNRIRLLAEGHGDVVDKLRGLDTLTEKVEDIQDTVGVLKHMVIKE